MVWQLFCVNIFVYPNELKQTKIRTGSVEVLRCLPVPPAGQSLSAHAQLPGTSPSRPTAAEVSEYNRTNRTRARLMCNQPEALRSVLAYTWVPYRNCSE